VDIPLHGVDSIAADLVAANFLVNVGLIQHKDTVALLVSLLGNYGY
jgi:hypothetical protein